MLPPHDHNIWVLLFEQTPAVLRWVLIVLTGGIFWLLQRIYLNHKSRVDKLENLIINNETKVDTNFKDLHKKVDKLIYTLIDKK